MELKCPVIQMFIKWKKVDTYLYTWLGNLNNAISKLESWIRTINSSVTLSINIVVLYMYFEYVNGTISCKLGNFIISYFNRLIHQIITLDVLLVIKS